MDVCTYVDKTDDGIQQTRQDKTGKTTRTRGALQAKQDDNARETEKDERKRGKGQQDNTPTRRTHGQRKRTNTHTHTHTHTLLASKHDNIRDVRWPCIECAAQWGPTLRPPWAMRGPSLPRAHYGSKLGPPWAMVGLNFPRAHYGPKIVLSPNGP
jgi:hypothetical protein